jgi:biopolymer transport protein ExbD
VNFARTRRAEVIVDVTPLIDIIFQLVLFFMVSTTFVTSPGIEVDLPRSSSDTILQDTDDMSVWVTAKGSVYVDDQPVDWAGLRQAFSRASKTNPSTLIIIKADQEVGHGRVVGVMDLARSFGLSRLAIATEGSGAGAQETE